uniref:Putative ca2+ sensor ef-hand superfamily n=2 Tax=Rhodnius prolixus TaxID=13249 RepID=R4G3M2_RHOPR
MKSEGKTSKSADVILKKPTHFTKQETESLLLIYDKLMGASNPDNESALVAAPVLSTKGKEGLERVVFRDLLHNTFGVNTEEILMDRIFCAFDSSCDGLVKQDEWLIGMSSFLKGSLLEKTAFAFSVYDLNNDGFIVREEMFNLLRNSLVKQPQDEDPDEGVKELVELVLKKLDRDKDGKVSFEDFTEAVQEEPLFLEAFGQCLPSDNAVIAFLSTLS